jgi:hypothetical protein
MLVGIHSSLPRANSQFFNSSAVTFRPAACNYYQEPLPYDELLDNWMPLCVLKPYPSMIYGSASSSSCSIHRKDSVSSWHGSTVGDGVVGAGCGLNDGVAVGTNVGPTVELLSRASTMHDADTSNGAHRGSSEWESILSIPIQNG